MIMHVSVALCYMRYMEHNYNNIRFSICSHGRIQLLDDAEVGTQFVKAPMLLT